MASLLSLPTLVESPFVIVKMGDYTFGNTSRSGNLKNGIKVTFPNFMQGMDVVKINGDVNLYTIRMVYGIAPGNDPNFLDKVFSSVGYGKIKISYGDWASPSFIFREEEAQITKVTSNVDFSSSRINYIITATGTGFELKAGKYNFGAASSKKPSDAIFTMLKSNQYGLTDVFYGMKDIAKVERMNLIPRNDKEVKLESQHMDALTYLTYLVNSMVSDTNQGDSLIKDSKYFLTIYDDTRGELGGPYFKITNVPTKLTPTVAKSQESPGSTFDLDIGYPTDNFVTSFSISTDYQWTILYDYSQKIEQPNYVYKLNDKGDLEATFSPLLSTLPTTRQSSVAFENWWTKVTSFPYSGTVTIKGLLRPAMLMTSLRINTYFYGTKHVSSGLYKVTRQQDTIDSNGYKTTLNLLRVPESNSTS